MGCCESSGLESNQIVFVNDANQQRNNNRIIEHNTNLNSINKATKFTSATEVCENNCIFAEQSAQRNNSNHQFDSMMISNKSSLPSKLIEIPRVRELKLPNIEVSESIIMSRKKLILKVVEAKYLEPGMELIINAGGLEGSERMSKDGIVLFGNRPTQKDAIQNDFNFPKEEQVGEKHFQIKYDIENDKYWAKDLYGSGLFMKLTQPIRLKNNTIFSLVTSHILVRIPLELNYSISLTNLSKEDKQQDAFSNDKNYNDIINNNLGQNTKNQTNSEPPSKIHLKVLYGINKDAEYFFDSIKSPIITFGRNKKSDNPSHIQIQADSISRLQCTIFYQHPYWYLMDSNGELTSMNGTWSLVDEFLPLVEGLILRAGTTSFECKLREPDYEEFKSE